MELREHGAHARWWKVSGSQSMRIDAHQQFWRYNKKEYDWIDDSMSTLRRDFLPADLEPELRRAGFDCSISIQARQSLEETKWLLELAKAAPFVCGVVGWVDLRSAVITAQLTELAANRKLLGIRHVVQSEPDDRFLLQPDFLRGMAALAPFDLTYDILIYPRHLPVAAEFVRHFPEQKFVLDHLAKPLVKSGRVEPWRTGIRELARFPKVFCKLSGLVTEANWKTWKPEHIAPYLDIVLEFFGPERLMIGSDWPVCTVAATYTQVMSLVIEYLGQYSAEVRQKILGENAVRFWNLQTTQDAAGSGKRGVSL